ncbi:PilW family protein [Paucibacter sp. APW11]|uniref:PilW family protein n=1 Tax=Roseateles aquae TaxID=3077235 RepID=A0ABU3PJ16_9BURK|nr:PilW family protein [Paucibacter sp. APW11]MDT9002137.1 PilW family protein [Paucibacter sp. APW11]
MKSVNHTHRRPLQTGFSLVEVSVGLLIGLLCTLVIATVLSSAEGQRRGTTQGSDAQVSGSLALYSIQRELLMAGYGFASEAPALGCSLQASFGGVAAAQMPAVLAPVLITQGAAGASDQLRVISSSKFIDPRPATLSTVGYTIPSRIIGPHYDPNAVGGVQPKTSYNVFSSISIRQGDLMVAVIGANQPCGMFQVTGVPGAQVVPRADDQAGWNAAKHPAQATVDGAFLVNLGRMVDIIYSVDANRRLLAAALDTSNLSRNSVELQGNIVMFKAMYGRSAAGNGVVDTYDYTTPSNNAEWQNVLAVRIAVLARSSQFEKDEVTPAVPQWDVGTTGTVADAATCGASKCVAMDISSQSDWKHYRYKLFDTIVPLRNQRWKS